MGHSVYCLMLPHLPMRTVVPPPRSSVFWQMAQQSSVLPPMPQSSLMVAGRPRIRFLPIIILRLVSMHFRITHLQSSLRMIILPSATTHSMVHPQPPSLDMQMLLLVQMQVRTSLPATIISCSVTILVTLLQQELPPAQITLLQCQLQERKSESEQTTPISEQMLALMQ